MFIIMYFSGSMGDPLNVKRNETKEIKINIAQDTEMCNDDRNKYIKYTYQWFIFDGQLILQLTTGNLY